MANPSEWARAGAGDDHPDRPSPAWSADDLRLDDRLRELLIRLLQRNDGSAVPEIVEVAGPRLHALELLACRAVGLCARAELALEWITETAVSLSTEVPGHPLAAAMQAMTARARAIATTLSAQPLPDEDGYAEHLPGQWMERLGLPPRDQRSMYIQLVVLHRQPLAVRWIVDDVAIHQRDLAASAAEHSLDVEQARALLRQGQRALLEAAERFEQGGGDG